MSNCWTKIYVALSPPSSDKVLDSPIENGLSCGQVYKVPLDQQCAFVRANCNDDEYQIGRINYLSMYYCSGFGTMSMGFLVVLLVSCFASLGLTASDYLCPNLYTISKFLNLSDNLAGLTLLALGNSSPDVLSTYKAMSVGSSDLALSESLGAAFFITTVVLGSMAIIHPFKVSKKLFLRDAGFFLVVATLIYFVLLDSYLSLSNCIILLATYLLYVVVALSTHSMLKAKLKKKLKDQRTRANFLLNDQPDEDHQDDDIFLDTFSNLPGIESLNFNENDEDETPDNGDKDVESDIPGSFGLKVLLKELTKHSHVHSRIKLDLDRPFTAPITFSSNSSSSNDREIQTLPDTSMPYRNSETQGDSYEEATDQPSQSFEFNNVPLSMRLVYLLRNEDSSLTKLLAPQLLDFPDQDINTKVSTILLLPISVFLRISNPVRDQATLKALKDRENLNNNSAIPFSSSSNEDSDEDDDFNFELDRSLLSTQAICGSIFLLIISPFHGFIFSLFSILFAYVMFYVVQKSYHARVLSDGSITNSSVVDLAAIKKLKVINYSAAFFGFVISLSWVSLFATEIISILKTVAVIYNLNDDILGVTVFAIGNSVGDLISNFTIARMGMPIMAFGACFGGPLLALCSMGLSGLILMDRDLDSRGFRIENTQTIRSTTIALIVNISLILALVPFNDWKFDRRIGLILILMWILATTFSLSNELLT
ncbi:uncharacterized protein CANTADRAFT_91289 [Suhomyces tanzawaensis NRRL Y-17324]|uniref:Sodium/calcium exchanger membrane region domain-containing protein n=1 Tax=Suhomyces tanzawaensis NRRL Y-17324 TaxID=984487 RepID=A0A1E4SEC2_9ASCO|nr:uncharacterized protein CANTADRAFT_91289 [Suhomyces tanzawaensis NRRL Y-17324]ODV77833.1 hypothetical protein CANTADRAFT_91289 [Suhomyces tanzawaensis NRRL Y-17324]